jgi:hypothetical protein
MVPEIVAKMMDALDLAKASPKSREMSLVITKLEEAIMWYNQGQRANSASTA